MISHFSNIFNSTIILYTHKFENFYILKCRSDFKNGTKLTIIFLMIPDKQQELDLPSLRIEDAVAATGSVDVRAAKKKDRVQRGPAAMSHISGVKRPLTHTNSFTGERVPLHGVETPHEEQLGKVCSIQFYK